MTSDPRPADDSQGVLVCGMGTLGVECARVLRRYAVPARAITLGEPDEPVDVPLLRGDCRQLHVLREAGAERCRAVLLVTGDARVNIEAALAVRKLNPDVRIVARAVDPRANALLGGLLGNFVTHDPNQLAAGALALAALRAETIGYFALEGRTVRIVQHRLVDGDHWIGARLAEVSTHHRVVLTHERSRAEGSSPSVSIELFHAYDPETALAEGDVVTLLAFEGTAIEDRAALPAPRVGVARPLPLRRLGAAFAALGRPAKVTAGAGVTVVLAVLLAIWLFPMGDPTLSRADAFFTAAVLMTGGTYADLFPAFNHLSNALRLFSVVLTIIGTVSVGLVYAWLTERLMTLRLRLVPRRARPPDGDHVVILGLGRIGQTAATLYRALARPAVAVEATPDEAPGIRDLPVVSGNGSAEAALIEGGIASARGFLAATGDDWHNLEMALLARTLNGECALAIRTHERRFSVNVAGVVPNLRVVCVPVVAAKAFVAAALGQTVLDLFQLLGRTVYVVEHRVVNGDGLDGRLLSEVAEGYGVVPVLYEAPGAAPRAWSVVDRPVVLEAGYRVVVLGSSTSLQCIARGEMRPRTTGIELQGLRKNADRVGAMSVLAQQLACSLEEAHDLLEAAPAVLARRCYPQQGRRLRSALELAGAVVALSDGETRSGEPDGGPASS